MANEFKIKKGLIVTGASGGTVVDIQGSQGQLFSVTDNLSGSIFAVSDISGVPIFDVNSSGLSTFSGNLVVDGASITIDTDTAGNSLLWMESDSSTVAGQLRGYGNRGDIYLYFDGVKKTELSSSNDSFIPALHIGGTAAASGGVLQVTGNANISATVTATTFSGDLNGTINTATTAVTQVDAVDNETVATTAYVNNKIQLIPAGLVFQGTWNASTNTPTLTSGSGTTGNFYIVSVAGSTNLDGITDWKVGDWAVFIEQGVSDQWEKIDNSSVLDGIGTGGTVAGWAGSGTSNTLTNSPITFSGNDSTFAGDITSTGLTVDYTGNRTGDAGILVTNDNSDWGIKVDKDGTADYGILSQTDGENAIVVRNAAGVDKIQLQGDGDATFAGDVTVGTGVIKTSIGGDIAITQGAIGLRINDSASAISPTTASANNDNTVDLGVSNIRWKDLYLGGDINLAAGKKLQYSANSFMTPENNVSGAEISTAGTFIVKTGTTPTLGLTLDATQNAIFTGDLYINSGTSYNDKGIIYLSNERTAIISDIVDQTANGDTSLDFQTRKSGTTASAMFIDEFRNVGIGTTSPGAKLEVSGSLFFRDFVRGYVGVGTTQYIGATWLNASDGVFYVRSADVDKVVLNSNGDSYLNGGNVGIGTTSPNAAKLHVETSSGSNCLKVGTTTQGVFIKTTGNVVDYNASGNISGEHAFSTGNIERMRISSAGAIKFNAYGAGTLVTDASGNITVSSGGGAGGPYLPLSAGSSYSLTDNLYINNVDQNNSDRYGNFRSEVGFTRSPVTGNPNQWFKVVELGGSPKRIKFSIISSGDNTNSYDNFLISTSGYGMYMHIEKLPGGKYNTSKLLSVAAVNPNNGGSVEIWIKLGPVSSGTGATYVACTSDVLASATILASATTTAPTITANDTQLDISNDNRLYATLQASRGATFGAKVGIGTNAPAAMLTVAGGDATISGNVGIGTTSTSQKLSLAGSGQNWSTSPAIKIWDSYNSKGWYVGSANNQTAGDFYIRSVTAENLYPVPANQQFTIKQSGNVGIGTISPNDALEVAGNNSTQHRIRINNAGTGTATLAFMQGATFKSWVEYNNSTGNLDVWQYTNNPLRFATNNTERMRIDSTGNVGIGTTTPQSKLQVAYPGNVNGGSMLLGQGGSGTDKWSFLTGTHYNQATGSGNGAGSAGVALIGSFANSTTNVVYIGGGPYEINAATQIKFYTNSTNLSTQGGTHVMNIANDGNIRFNTYGAGTLVTDASGNITAATSGPGTGDITGSGAANYVTKFTGTKTIGNGPIYFNSSDIELLQPGVFNNSLAILYNGTASGGTGTTAVQYIKIFDKSGNSGQQYLHFELLSFNNSEYSAEVRITVPSYSGFSSSYGTMDAGQGVQVEIIYGGLSTQTSSILSIIECADLSNTNTNTDLYLKIQPAANNTQIKVKDYGDCTTRVLTNQTWSTTAPSNQHREFTFNVGATNINEVLSIHRDQKVGIGTDSPGNKLAVQSSFTTLANDCYVEINSGHEASGGSDFTGKAGILFKQAGSGNVLRNAGSIVSGREGNYSATSLADSYLAFSTAINNVNTERMRIDSSGNVGIGTTTPLAKLDIQGTQGQLFSVTDDLSGSIFAVSDISGVPIFDVNSSGVSYFDGNVGIGTTSPVTNASYNKVLQINAASGVGAVLKLTDTTTGAAAADGFELLQYGTSSYLINREAGDMNFRTSNLQRMIIQAGGNVGIGMTNPAVPLDVEGKIRSNDSNSGDYLEIFCDGSVSGDSYIENTNNNIQIKSAFATSFSTSGSVAMFIDDSQNVGIGTTSPTDDGATATTLEVRGKSGTGGGVVRVSNAGNTASARFFAGSASATIGTFTNHDLAISTNNSLKMTVKAGGNVGIGTTNPGAKLQVDGGIRVVDGTKAAPSYSFGNDPDTGMFSDLANTLRFGTGANTRMTIEPSGEVGINTTGPSAALHLKALTTNGVPFKLEGDSNTTVEQMLIITSKAYNSTDAWYNLVTQAGDGSGGATNTCIIERDGDLRNKNNSYGQISDSRLKENIIDATPKLEDVMKVKVKNFNFIGEDLKQIGVVAQELEEVFPGLVKEEKQPDVNGEEGGIYKSVKYSVLVPILVKAMQEQQEIIEELKIRITKLEN